MKEKTKYINFMIWLQCDTKHLDYDPVTAVDEYYKFKCECKDEWLFVKRINLMKCKKCGKEF